MSIIQVCLFWYRILDAEQRLNIWQGPFGFLSDSNSYPIRQIVVRPFARQAPHLVSKFGHRPYGYMSKFFSRAVWSLHLDQHVIFLALREPHLEGGNPPLSIYLGRVFCLGSKLSVICRSFFHLTTRWEFNTCKRPHRAYFFDTLDRKDQVLD